MLATSTTLEQAQSAAALSQAEQVFAQLSTAISEVSREGIGSSRLIQIPSTAGAWQLVPEQDLIEFSLSTSPLEPLVRRIRDNLIYISGFDANCSLGNYTGTPAWILENSYLKIYLQKINGTALNTANNILALQSKVTNKTIVPADSSIQIDGSTATSSGTGFSEMRTGSLPKCRAHFFVNTTTLDYDIFYTLYSGADFLEVEVRNIS
jgi:hypothetical protein